MTPRILHASLLLFLLSIAPTRAQVTKSAESAPTLPDARRALLILGSYTRVLDDDMLETADQEAYLDAIRQMPRGDAEPLLGRAAEIFLLRKALHRRTPSQAALRRRELKGLRSEMIELVIKGVFKGAAGTGEVSFADFRRGPGAPIEAWLFDSRRSRIAKMLSDAEIFEASSQLAACVERWCAVRVPSAALPTKHLRWKALKSVRGERIKRKGKPWTRGLIGTRGVEVRYTGSETLHDVVVVACVNTTGKTIALSKGQLDVLGWNAATGFNDHNRDVARLMRVENLIASMPIAGHGYVRTLEKGQRFRVLLPESVSQDAYVSTAVCLYSSRGRSAVIELRKKRKKPAPAGFEFATGAVVSEALSKELSRLGRAGRGSLLLNGGCDQPLDADGNIPGWTEHLGQWHKGGKFKPAHGSGSFSANGVGVPKAVLSQTVSLRDFVVPIDGGEAEVHFDGVVRSYDQGPGDTAQVLITFQGAGEEPLVGGYDSGHRLSFDSWEDVGTTIPIPAGARTVEVRLVTIRHRPRRRNKQKNVDGHFDDLSLRVETR